MFDQTRHGGTELARLHGLLCSTGQTLARYINKAYASARGIEVTLEKRYSDHYSFLFSYTYSFADGVASDTEFGANPEGLAYLPNQDGRLKSGMFARSVASGTACQSIAKPKT